MKRVCHLLDSLEIGGLQKTVCAIARGVSGYEHHVWCLRDRGVWAAGLASSGTPVRAFDFSGGLHPASLGTLVKALRAAHIDIVHAHGVYPSEWARLAALCAGVKARIVHEQSIYCNVRLKERVKLCALVPLTSAFIAVSDAVKESLMREFRVPQKRIEVIYNSAGDTLRPPSTKAAVRAALGVGAGKVIGSVGRLEPHKGYAVLIDAMARLRRQGEDVTSLIAGDGPDRVRLEQCARDAGVGDHIHFLGMRADIPEILAALDIFVQPSTVREGLPLVLAEADAAALPSVVTDIGGNPEAVADGETGFVVPSGDAPAIAASLTVLLRDEALRARMGAAARALWQERFMVQEMCARVKRLYERVAPDS